MSLGNHSETMGLGYLYSETILSSLDDRCTQDILSTHNMRRQSRNFRPKSRAQKDYLIYSCRLYLWVKVINKKAKNVLLQKKES